MNTSPDVRIRVRDVDLTVRDLGSPHAGAPDLIWGHGLTSSMAREDQFGLLDWERVGAVCRVVRYDARGHGTSESTEDVGGYHWRELALDQLALADRLGVSRYIAAGASMGCATALHAAVLAPERIVALALVIPPTAWETRAAQRELYQANAHLVSTGRIERIIEGGRALPLPDPLADVPAWRAGLEDTMRSTEPARLARALLGASYADLPSRDEVAAIAAPALVLAWTGDRGHPMSTAEELARVMPSAELVPASTPAELGTWTARTCDFLEACGMR